MDMLLARIEARVRHSGIGHLIEIEELTIDTNEETVNYQSRSIELKSKPFDVFAQLAHHHDQIVCKEQLLDATRQIREKVDKPLGITTIETVRRRGYRLYKPINAATTVTRMMRGAPFFLRNYPPSATTCMP